MKNDKKKVRATHNTAKDVEAKTRSVERRKKLATRLGELTYERTMLVRRLNENAKESNKIGDQMEALDNGTKKKTQRKPKGRR